MSGEGPESIPTSADPRSRRPTKKRALSPTSAQAASVTALFAKPDREIRMPPPAATSSSTALSAGANRRAPPEIITNVQGSSAGAGSGEFHVYKASRRREYERLRDMDADLRRQRDQEQFERERAEQLLRDNERTRRNREKREKLKARKAKAKNSPAPGGPAAGEPKGVLGGSAAVSARQQQDERPQGNGQGGARVSANKDEQAAMAAPAVVEPGLVIHDDDD